MVPAPPFHPYVRLVNSLHMALTHYLLTTQYIAPAADAGGAYYYPYAQAQQGQDGIPRMSVVGRAPTNNNPGIGLGYGAPVPGVPTIQESKEMQDAVEVKV